MHVPALVTDRLAIRPFVMGDLDAIHRVLDVELAQAETGTEGAKTYGERATWLQWTTLGYEELARLHQPPYGERAIALRESGEVIGACGYVPCLDAFGQILSLGGDRGASHLPGRTSTEFGLYWAVSPTYQRQGYATEAARALIDHAFTHLRLTRIIATTDGENVASQGVMRRLGMRLERNPLPTPPWLQVVGILEPGTG